MKHLFLVVMGAFALTHTSLLASQALLDCQGSKVKLEAWFTGETTPSDVYIYEIDPSLGIPAQYRTSHFEWTSSKLELFLESIDQMDLRLELHLLPDQVNGGYSGTLLVINRSVAASFPDHRCDFR